MIRKMLMQMRFFQDVVEADGGHDAWSKLSDPGTHGAFGFILSDVDLTGMSGIDLLKQCRKDPRLRFLPFIMVSASSQGATVASALGEWGANDFIVKPFSYELLNQRIGALLKSWGSPQESLFRQAQELQQLGQVENALKLIEHWEVENRNMRAKWLNLKGECLLQSGQTDNASTQFENAMASSAIFISAYKNFAAVNEKLGRKDKAIKALKHVEAISPTSEERTLLLARLLLQTGQTTEGKLRLQDLVKRTSGPEKESTLDNVGKLYLESGLFEEAEPIFAHKLLSNPTDLELSNRLAIALRQQKKFDKAEQCYLEALARHPDHPGIYHNLGILYMLMRAYDKAEDALRKAIAIDPGFKDAQGLLKAACEKRRNA